MTFLVDSHVLLWWLADGPKLSPVHRDIIGDGANEVFVSSITVAELSLKASLGKLVIPDDLLEVITLEGFDELPFSSRHAIELRRLPWHHRDPFDRMLISQARSDGLVFLTGDERCRDYDIATK